MYLEHFGLQEPPFRITPATGYFFAGAGRGDILTALQHALDHDEGIIKITGEVGSGKTMLLRMLLDRLPQTTVPVWLSNPSLSPEELLRTIAFQLGAEAHDGKPLLDSISERLICLWAKGRRAVALIDEAHAMPIDSLEQVRLLSNLETEDHKLLQIVLFGQPELDETLTERSTRPILDRITHHFELFPLSRYEVVAYIEHRLGRAGYRGRELFTGPAIRALAHSSEGLTRRINILADKALLAAYASGARYVGLSHMRAAARDARMRDPIRPLTILAGCVVLAALAGAVTTQLLERADNAPATPVASQGSSTKRTAPVRTPVPPQGTSEAKPQSTPEPVSESKQVTRTEITPDPVVALLGEFLAARLTESQAWLDHVDGRRWCVQISDARPGRAVELEVFLRRLDKLGSEQPFRIYAAPGDPIGRISVVWGDFGTVSEAQNGVATLPAWVRRGTPYVRSISSLRPSPSDKAETAVNPNSVNMKVLLPSAQESNRRP